MPTNESSKPASSRRPVQDRVVENVTYNVNGDNVAGNKNIYISVEAVTQLPLVSTSPYRGLERFEDRDKELFFGRDQLIKSVLAQLSTSNVLLVLGASGSGKSSVVRAGLLPALSGLRGVRFRYFTLVPDANPFESLRSSFHSAGFTQSQTRDLADAEPGTPFRLIRALQRDGDQWLIFVDQFEEIFTVSDERLRKNFIAALLEIAQDASDSTKLVLAMRADFLDRFSPFPEFTKLIEKNISLVADMQADEIRLAIEQPAAKHGMVFEKGLVEEIIKDVQDQAGPLPLLQYTLHLLWEKERLSGGFVDRHLNTSTYREIGGVRGALQKRADEIYASFGDKTDSKETSAKQEIVRRIFLRLVDIAGTGADDAASRPVRRRTPMATFSTDQEKEVLTELINQKLLVSDRKNEDIESTVEVAHEALFTSWERLKKWIEGAKQVIFVKNRLSDDARRWHRRQKEDRVDAEEELLSGSRLGQALEMRARGDFVTIFGGLPEAEAEFLDGSAGLRDRRKNEEEARRQKEVEDARALAEERRQRLEETRRLRYISIAQALAAQAPRQMVEFGQHERAALLARQAYLFHEANRGGVLDQIDQSLRDVLTRSYFAITLRPPSSGEAPVSCLAFSSDGLRLAIGQFPFLYITDASGPGEWRVIFESDAENVPTVAFDPRDDWLAWGTAKGKVCMRNLRDPQSDIIELGTHPGTINVVAFSPDGQILASAGGDFVRLWRFNAPKRPYVELKSQDDDVGEVSSVAFSPDGKLLVSCASDRQIRLWNTRRPKQSCRFLQGTQIWAKEIAFGSNSLLAAAGDMGLLEIWDVAANPPKGMSLPSPMAESVAFSPDGRLLAVGGMHGQIELRDVHHLDAQPEVLRGHTNGITKLAFAPDGRCLASSSADGTVRLWDLIAPKAAPVIRPAKEELWNSAYCVACSGSRIAVSFDTGFVQLFDATDPLQTQLQLRGDALGPVRGALPIDSVAFVPNRNAIVTGHQSTATWLWDLDKSPPHPVALPGQEGWVGAVAVSPDGNLVASCGGDGCLRIWEISRPKTQPRILRILPEKTERGLQAIAFSQASPLLAVGGADGRIVLLRYDRPTDEAQPIEGHTALVNALAFSPDGRKLASGSDDRRVRVLDLETNKSFELLHEGKVRSVSFSPDGNWLATGSTDGVIRLWDIRRPNGSAVMLRGHDDMVSCVAFTGDGKRLVSAGWDGTVRLWMPWTSVLADLVCATVWRNLDEVEWHAFIGEGINCGVTCG